MPELAAADMRDDQFSNAAPADGIWSQNRDGVSGQQLEKVIGYSLLMVALP